MITQASNAVVNLSPQQVPGHPSPAASWRPQSLPAPIPPGGAAGVPLVLCPVRPPL